MKAIDVLRAVKCLLFAILLASFTSGSRAAVLAKWDFNTPGDGNTNGTTVVSEGAGTAALVGGTSQAFFGGSPNDPASTTDNSGWSTASYPAQGSNNKTAGVQFNVSTLGYERIIVTWDQRHSATASRYIRFQYSTNGVDFSDGPSIEATAMGNFIPHNVDLSSLAVVNNQANFAFRIVSEFQDTATGSGAAQYVGTTSGYGTSGTWRFDMVTVTAEPYSGNEFPTISTITNQTIRMETMSPDYPFEIGDAESAAEALVVTASSSDPVLLPNENIFLGGTGSNRTVRVLPAFGQSGNVTVTLTVTDEFGNASRTSFVVTVLPNNTPPTISSFTNYHSVVNTPLAPIAFTVGDTETAAGNLTVSAASSNPTLIPDSNIVLGGSGADRSLTISPAPQQSGNAVVTVTVSDGDLSTNRQFAVMIVPSPSVVLFEPFNYTDGSATTVSGSRWSSHSGTPGQTQITAGQLLLSNSQSEDINSVLIGAPYASDSGRTLYLAFTVNFKTLPLAPGEYFAHFLAPNSTTTFRARVFATTLNAELGFYRLAIANNSSSINNAAAFPLDLAVEADYLIVLRYEIATGVSTLWIDPKSESDPSVTASDNPSVISINAWAFRQSSTANGHMGAPHIDDLTVGFSFADVLPGYRLSIAPNGSGVEISWPAAATDEGYFLESTADLNAPAWGTVTAVPVRNSGTDTVTVNSPTGMRFYRLAK